MKLALPAVEGTYYLSMIMPNDGLNGAIRRNSLVLLRPPFPANYFAYSGTVSALEIIVPTKLVVLPGIPGGPGAETIVIAGVVDVTCDKELPPPDFSSPPPVIRANYPSGTPFSVIY